MAPTRNEAQLRRALLAEARELLGPGAGPLVVIVARGEVVTVRAGDGPGPVPEGTGRYDASLLRALTTRPQTSARLARLSGHPNNSHFRAHLAALVESGLVRHTRRGYSRPSDR
jgi:hypothetical protein